MQEVASESGETKLFITCSIKTVAISFTEDDFNKYFNLPEDNICSLAIDEVLVDFLDLIHYAAEIDLVRLNKKYVMRE